MQYNLGAAFRLVGSSTAYAGYEVKADAPGAVFTSEYPVYFLGSGKRGRVLSYDNPRQVVFVGGGPGWDLYHPQKSDTMATPQSDQTTTFPVTGPGPSTNTVELTNLGLSYSENQLVGDWLYHPVQAKWNRIVSNSAPGSEDVVVCEDDWSTAPDPGDPVWPLHANLSSGIVTILPEPPIDWTTVAEAGDILTIDGMGSSWVEILAVGPTSMPVSDTATEPHQGRYAIHTSFSPKLDLPLPNSGDTQIASLVHRTNMALDDYVQVKDAPIAATLQGSWQTSAMYTQRLNDEWCILWTDSAITHLNFPGPPSLVAIIDASHACTVDPGGAGQLLMYGGLNLSVTEIFTYSLKGTSLELSSVQSTPPFTAGVYFSGTPYRSVVSELP